MNPRDGEPGGAGPGMFTRGTLALAGGLLAYYLLLALTRRIDADEGYFLSAAQFARWRLVPYLNFYYPQGPLLPYLHGGLMTLLGGINWTQSRMVAALLATMTGVGFWWLLAQRVRSNGVRLVLFATYLASDFGLEWAPTLKSLLPAVLFPLLGLACLAEPWLAGRHVSLRRWALCGACVGLGVLCRLTVLGFAGVLGLWLAWQAAQRQVAWRAVAVACGAGLLMLLPLGMLALLDPASVYLCVLRSHTVVAPDVYRARWANDARVFLETNLNGWVLLAWLLVAWWWLGGLRREQVNRRLAEWDLLSLGGYLAALAGAIAPIWALHQYYALGTPWLLLAAAPALEAWWRRVGGPWSARHRGMARGLAAAGLAVWLINPYFALERFWPQWTWHPRSFQAAEEFEWRLSTVAAVQRVVDAHAQPHERVLTWWPGYVIGTRAWLWPGLNDHNSLRISRFLSPQAAWAAKATTNDEVDAAIRERKPGLIVAGRWTGEESWYGMDYYLKLIHAAGYVEIERIGQTRIFAAPGRLAPDPATR